MQVEIHTEIPADKTTDGDSVLVRIYYYYYYLNGIRCKNILYIKRRIIFLLYCMYNFLDTIKKKQCKIEENMKKNYDFPFSFYYLRTFVCITSCTKIIAGFLILLLHFIIGAVPLPSDYSPSKEESKGLIAYKRMAATDIYSKLKSLLKITKRILKFKFLTKRKKVEIYKDSDDETLDWWSKYFASLQV